MALRPSLQQVMLRIKDPKISVPFYENNFGMKLVHWLAFPQWKFTVYFMEKQREGQVSPECSLEKTSVECEKYINNMTGACIELTHNHGTEDQADFKVWNGNTGKDAGEGPNYAEEPAARGFGHIAFNCDDVYEATDKLLAAGVPFQKKPDEGRMKGLAFALDPDGYWIELVARKPGVYAGPQNYYNLSQTMLRVKDGPKTVEFYTKVMGMTNLREMHFEQWGFSLFFLVSATPEDLEEAFNAQDPEVIAAHGGSWATFDPMKENQMTKTLWPMCLELTWNHGTEKDENFQVHDGNAEPQGFGHIGFLVDDLKQTQANMLEAGVAFKKKEEEGGMRNLAFAYDPDRYWVELIDRQATFAGIAENY